MVARRSPWFSPELIWAWVKVSWVDSSVRSVKGCMVLILKSGFVVSNWRNEISVLPWPTLLAISFTFWLMRFSVLLMAASVKAMGILSPSSFSWAPPIEDRTAAKAPEEKTAWALFSLFVWEAESCSWSRPDSKYALFFTSLSSPAGIAQAERIKVQKTKGPKNLAFLMKRECLASPETGENRTKNLIPNPLWFKNLVP